MEFITLETAVDKLLRSSDLEVDYLSLILYHHQDAIKMATMWLNRTSDSFIRNEINRIIRSQSADISLIEGLLQNLGIIPLSLNINANIIRSESLIRGLNISSDEEFVRRMIVHHSEGTQLSRILLKGSSYLILPEVRRLAQRIIEEQSSQNQRFLQYLKI